MADKKGFVPTMPTAPPGASEYFPHRGPPPTYEESQKPDFPPRPPPSYYATVNGSPHSYNNQLAQSGQHFQQPYPQLPQPMITGFGAAPGSHMIAGMPQSGMCPQSKVIEFDAGARFRGQGSGSITVPPPPPGCAPTAAQLAALQGQPVILKKKKNSFF